MIKRIVSIIAALIVGAVLVLSGCASKQTVTDQGDTTSGSMLAVERDIRIVVVDINTANQMLAALINPSQEDVSKAFDSYSDSVGTLGKSSAVYIVHSDQMGVQGREYFEEWRVQGTSYVNPQIRALSEQRRTELSNEYAMIAETSIGVKGSLNSLLSMHKEIAIYFTTDLTPRGVEVMTPVALEAIFDGNGLNNSFEDVLGSISNVRYELLSSDDL